ncbi:MAG TPA: hypothetical protein VGH94_09615 [Acidimicrobiales bacterium]|jgi:predicted lipoprotein with Yx(FWY)xxD motif
MTQDVETRSGWRRLPLVAAVATAALLLAACGSSSKSTSTGSAGATTTTAASASADPGTSFRTATVTGLGSVLVDARGHTVYVLTADGTTNAPCTDASGCTAVWPDLPLPDGTTVATAGPGLQPALLGTMMGSDGETYPTYHGWLMYEFSRDTGPAQANGQGITSFGGTWYALGPAGAPIKAAKPASVSSTNSGKGY